MLGNEMVELEPNEKNIERAWCDWAPSANFEDCATLELDQKKSEMGSSICRYHLPLQMEIFCYFSDEHN
jgi:hypothetical protein